MTLLLGRRPICLVDEPEMCLHPPQAYALGRFIGKHGTAEGHTTLVATHSSHVLRGILDATSELEIIRLSRVGSRFSAEKIVQSDLKEAVERPSTKVETILDGIFAEAVTIVESEGDRLVYGTAWERIAHEFKRDVHFVSVGGTGGFADTCRLYKTLKIPVCVIADIDLIGELETFKKVVSVMTHSENKINIWQRAADVLEQIKKSGPLLSHEEFKAELHALASQDITWGSQDELKPIRTKLSDLSSQISPTARLKRGLNGFDPATSSVHSPLKLLLGECRRIGLFLVPNGELEDWLPHLMKDGPSRRNKSAWANTAAMKLRQSPTEAGDIWGFVRETAQYQVREAEALGGFPVS